MRQNRKPTLSWQASLGLTLALGLVGCSGEPSISIQTKPMPAKVTLAPQVNRPRGEGSAARPSMPPSSLLAAAPAAAPPPPPMPPAQATRPAETRPQASVPERAPTRPVAAEPVPVFESEDDQAAGPAVMAAPPAFRSNLTSARYKKPPMPAGMPTWFDERDQDSDGMVGMYEWPPSDLATFRKYDLNGDGFISIEEALRTVPRTKVASAPTAPANPGTTSAQVTAANTPTSSGAPANGAAPSGGTAPTSSAGVGTTLLTATPAGSANPSSAVAIDDNDRRGAEQFINRFGGRKLQGKLAQDEMPAWLPGRDRFGEFDADKDGYLDSTELATLFKSTRGQRGGFGGGFGGGRDGGGRDGPRMIFGGPGGGPGGGGGAGISPGGGFNRDPEAMAQRMFDRIKERGNGKVTIDAWTQSFMPRDLFSEVDVNKDGEIDFDEFKSAFSRGLIFGRGGRRSGGG